MDELRFQSELNEMWWDLSDTPGISDDLEDELVGYALEATATVVRFKRRRTIVGALAVLIIGSLMSAVPLAIVLLIVGLS